MKTFSDRLKSMPIELLEQKIREQEAELVIVKRDLATMKDILAERISAAAERPTADKHYNKL